MAPRVHYVVLAKFHPGHVTPYKLVFLDAVHFDSLWTIHVGFHHSAGDFHVPSSELYSFLREYFYDHVLNKGAMLGTSDATTWHYLDQCTLPVTYLNVCLEPSNPTVLQLVQLANHVKDLQREREKKSEDTSSDSGTSSDAGTFESWGN